jgi:hypothetical protein
MELTSLHPIDPNLVAEYVRSLQDERHPGGLQLAFRRAAEGDQRSLDLLTHGLGQQLLGQHPAYFQEGLSLTGWEARIDRGIGMLMRPPARLFLDAGLDPSTARLMPIRLDLAKGMMGGAYIPARLLPDLDALLNNRLERSVKRLVDAELDPVAVMSLLLQAVEYARANGLGLYEAMDVVTPDVGGALPPGARVIVFDRKRVDKSLRMRIELAAKPAKKPGIFARLSGRGARSGNGTVGHVPESEH